MNQLTDTQLVLLSTASQRESHSFYPLPETLTGEAKRIAAAVDTLVTIGLAEELETNDKACIHRTDGDLSFGIFLTEAGGAAIDSGEPVVDMRPATSVDPAPRNSKSNMVLDLLRRDDGATLPELIEATGWLPHTTRAALTGLRKKGLGIERGKRGTETCYKIAA